RMEPNGRVEEPSCRVRILAQGCVAAETAFLTNGSRLRRKRKAGEHKQGEKWQTYRFELNQWIHIILPFSFPAEFDFLRLRGPEKAKNLAGRSPPPDSDPFSDAEFWKNRPTCQDNPPAVTWDAPQIFPTTA